MRWCARSVEGSSAGTDARRLLRRDRGRRHHLRRRDPCPGRRRLVVGPAGRRHRVGRRPRCRQDGVRPGIRPGAGCHRSHHEPHLHARPRLRGPPARAPPRRVPPRADERGPRPRGPGDARRGWRRAHRVGRRHPADAPPRLPRGPAHLRDRRRRPPRGVPGRGRDPGRSAPMHWPACSRPGTEPTSAHPWDHHLHGPGRLRDRRARGCARRHPVDAWLRGTPRRSPLRSSSCAGRPASSSATSGPSPSTWVPGSSPGCASAWPPPRRCPTRCRLPMIGVTSLDLLAFPLRHSPRRIVCALDAGRGEIFHAAYRQSPGGVQRGARPRWPAPRTLRPTSSLGEEVLLAGDGALRYQSVFEPVRRVELADRSEAYPLAGSLVQLAHARASRGRSSWVLSSSRPPTFASPMRRSTGPRVTERGADGRSAPAA